MARPVSKPRKSLGKPVNRTQWRETIRAGLNEEASSGMQRLRSKEGQAGRNYARVGFSGTLKARRKAWEPFEPYSKEAMRLAKILKSRTASKKEKSEAQRLMDHVQKRWRKVMRDYPEP